MRPAEFGFRIGQRSESAIRNPHSAIPVPSALAITAHPDDIEFRIAGALLLLKDRGWDIHCWNLCSGSLGSTVMTAAQTARTRRAEAREAARLMGAGWFPPLVPDMELLYELRHVRRICSVIREVKPTVILTHPPQDYMEDHMVACRLTVTGAFARNIPNHPCTPRRPPMMEPCTIYHCVPHGLGNNIREPFTPDLFVDITGVHARKRAALACHRSQKEWLDASQGMDSYLAAMDAEAVHLGRQSRRFKLAEAFRRHLHYGYCEAGDDPLAAALGRKLVQPAAGPLEPMRA
jgi:N-acetylglucosamine malate deacetylase 1